MWQTILNKNGGDVKLLQNFIPKDEAKKIFDILSAKIEWKQEEIEVMGKKYYPTRKTAVYGNEGVKYRYSGVTKLSSPWIPELGDLKDKLESTINQKFNFVLCNYYPNGYSSIGYHSDDERDLEEGAIIASVSLGESRDFLLKHKHDSGIETIKVSLHSGSLLTMGGETQKNWKHTIPVRKKVVNPRINLTFRKIITK